jgi:hypothetical protein
MSKWYGDANRFIRAIFTLAAKLEPAVIFIGAAGEGGPGAQMLQGLPRFCLWRCVLLYYRCSEHWLFITVCTSWLSLLGVSCCLCHVITLKRCSCLLPCPALCAGPPPLSLPPDEVDAFLTKRGAQSEHEATLQVGTSMMSCCSGSTGCTVDRDACRPVGAHTTHIMQLVGCFAKRWKCMCCSHCVLQLPRTLV